jgi:RNA polymerase sigma-70 factor (ECF subfamily)
MVTWTAWADRLEDEALLAAIAQGDAVAATVFVRRHQRRVYGLAITMCRDEKLAEDLAQQTFERVWHHAGNFDPRLGSARTWVSTITRRLCIDVLRTTRSTPIDPIDLAALLPPDRASVEDLALAGVEVHRLRWAVAALPEEQRRAVLYSALGGHTAAEVAEIEDIPLGTAKTRLRQGMLRLRGLLVEGAVDA